MATPDAPRSIPRYTTLIKHPLSMARRSIVQASLDAYILGEYEESMQLDALDVMVK